MKKCFIFCLLVSLLFILVACSGKKTKLEFQSTQISVKVGETFTLEPTTKPKGAEVIYDIKDRSILSYENGVFTALKEGTTTIIAKLKGQEKVQVTITVTVIKEDDHEDDTQVMVSYELNGGSFTEEVPTSYKREDLPIPLPKPSRKDYVFVGWYDNPDFNGHYIDELPEDVEETVTLYARWVPLQTYSLLYVLYGGTNDPNNPFYYTIYDLPLRLEEPTRPGYYFRGWYKDQNFRHGPIEEITIARNYRLYALWESQYSQDQILIDSSLTDKSEGDRIEYRGIEYVYGINAFSTLRDGFAVARHIVHLKGEFSENLTIEKSGLTILGPNANIDPNSEERVEEAVLKGIITLAPNVTNITFNGLAFTDKAQITGGPDSKNRNITFIYNLVYDTKKATKEWSDKSYSTGFFVFKSLSNDELVNFTIKNNRFERVSDVNINFSRVTNVHIEGNTFKNFERDAIRFDDGGWNHGEFMFLNNRFENDVLSGYNAIYFSAYGGTIPTLIHIENNTFINIGHPTLDAFSGAISLRDYKYKGQAKTDIIIEFNTFEGCANFIHVRNHGDLASHEQHLWSGRANYNLFRGVPQHYYYKNWIGEEDNAETNPERMNLDYNYFEDDEGHPIVELQEFADYFLNAQSYENNYTTYESYAEMLANLQLKKIFIMNRITELAVGEMHSLIVSVQPYILQGIDLRFESSDPSVLSVTEEGDVVAVGHGTATITVYSPDSPEIKATMEVYVPDPIQLEIHFEGSGALDLGESLQLIPVVKDGNTYTFTWESSNPNIASVNEEGLVEAIQPGEVTITARINGKPNCARVTLIVYDRENTSEILRFFIDNNRGIVSSHSIYYIGSDDGSLDYLNSFYIAVNNYLFEELKIIRKMLPEGRPNHSGRTMPSLEFITIHDTANTGADALGNSNWAVNPGNTGSSWHYTVGNDGIYQQLEDHVVGWHAGDGSRAFELIDTGVKATRDNPEVAINERGFFTFDGVESNILAPAVAQITQFGIYVTVGENGNYWMNRSYFNSTYRMVVNHGGNSNSIGIETAVNNGSDIHWTWQRTAKLVAQLMDTYHLGMDRIMFHNSFSGKECPRTMITADLVEEFLTLVRAEYEFIQKFADYEITFTSHHPEILGNNGRIIKAPSETTTVSYTITVKKGDVTETLTLYNVVLAR